MNFKQTHILGSKLDLFSCEQVISNVERWLGEKAGKHHIVTLNPEISLIGERDLKYRKLINKADLTIRDGFGLSLGAFILGAKRTPRITGRVILDQLLSSAVSKNVGIYLLGGMGNTAKKAAAKLKEDYPGLIISGAESGPSHSEFTVDSPEIVSRINKSKAKVLLVAFGAPKQESWIQNNLNSLDHISVAIGVGGVFDYIVGNTPIPPVWMQKIGLEWLFRLFTQKGRLMRIINAVIIFPLVCIKWRLRMILTFRKNVIAAVSNSDEELLLVSPAWSDRIKWQFPQGGIDENEEAGVAVLREMAEELGTDKFRIISHNNSVYRYVWPKWYRLLRGYKGQKQDLFFLEFTGDDADINIENEGELASWKWVDESDVIKELAPSRKSIGEIVLGLRR